MCIKIVMMVPAECAAFVDETSPPAMNIVTCSDNGQVCGFLNTWKAKPLAVACFD